MLRHRLALLLSACRPLGRPSASDPEAEGAGLRIAFETVMAGLLLGCAGSGTHGVKDLLRGLGSRNKGLAACQPGIGHIRNGN
jgi:hypothetical protein